MSVGADNTLESVRAIYSGAEGELWELLMGQQIHIGGFKATMDLAERAQIAVGQRGVDLCGCNGAGMRVLVRFRGVAAMTGVDATKAVIERGNERCWSEGVSEQVRFIHGDACATGLPGGAADFVWSEDAWCYVFDKARLISEAVRVVKSDGTIAFTDWISGTVAMTAEEADRFLRFMKFPNIQNVEGYRDLLESEGCTVMIEEDKGAFCALCRSLSRNGRQTTDVRCAADSRFRHQRDGHDRCRDDISAGSSARRQNRAGAIHSAQAIIQAPH